MWFCIMLHRLKPVRMYHWCDPAFLPYPYRFS